MTYSTEVRKPFKPNEMLVILRPRRRVQTWTLYSGTVYYASFDYGRVNNVFENNAEVLTNVESIADLTTDSWFYDKDNDLIYLDIGEDPDNQYITVAFDLYMSTRNYNWYANPLDITSNSARYRGDILNQPSVSERVIDTIFGFTATEITSVSVSNGDGFYNRFLYDSSFKNAQAIIYHAVGESISTANINEIARGVCSNFTNNDETVTIELNGLDSLFDNEFASAQYASVADFSGLNPAKEDAPIPKVYGCALVEAIGITYNDQATVSNNRDWLISQSQTNVATLTKTMLSYSSGVITVADASGIEVGDQIRLSFASDTDITVNVTAVNYNTNTITTDGGAKTFTASDSLTRPWVKAVYVVSTNIALQIKLNYITDFSIATFANATKGISLEINFEANHSDISALDMAQHKIVVLAYGETDVPVDAVAGAIGAVSDYGGNLQNPIAIIYKLLSEIRQLPSGSIIGTSFNALADINTQRLGFSIPFSASDTVFPTYRELINKLLVTSLTQIKLTKSSGVVGIGISSIAPIGTIDDTFNDLYIANYKQESDYLDIYSNIEANAEYYVENPINITFPNPREALIKTQVNNEGKYLHQTDLTFSFDSILRYESELTALVQNLSALLGDRRSFISFLVDTRYIELEINDNVTLSRTKLNGFTLDNTTKRSRNFKIIELQKNVDYVQLKLVDQKGVEDADDAENWNTL